MAGSIRFVKGFHLLTRRQKSHALARSPRFPVARPAHQVIQSLIKIATSNSARFHFSRPVSRVRVDKNGEATGIIFPDGTEASADVVVVNADLAWAHKNLFWDDKGGRRDPRLANRLEGKPHS